MFLYSDYIYQYGLIIMLNNEPNWLNPEEYQMIIAPSLKVSAELAASRGDPKLYKELASMLCLMHLATSLRELYVNEWGVMGAMSSEASLAEAPHAACAMVFAEGGVELDTAGTMLEALERAYQQVIEAGLARECDEYIQQAWAAMKEGENEQFLALIEQGAKTFAVTVDSWEKTR